MVTIPDSDIVVSEFELQLHNYVHFRTNIFGKGIAPLFLSAVGLIEPQLLLSYKDNFSIQ